MKLENGNKITPITTSTNIRGKHALINPFDDAISELKPCPFCGGEAILHSDCEDPYWHPTYNDPDSGGNSHKTVSCHSCHFCIDIYDTDEKAIKAWNHRV